MIIRPATQDDARDIASIWNPYIRATTVTFTTAEKSAADVSSYIAARQCDGMGVVVAETDASIAGFAASSTFRSGPGYAHTLETSVMLRSTAIGQGAGSLLMRAIEDQARAFQIHSLVAGISGENDAAIAFHARLGFSQVGHMPGVGRKFDRWLDLVLMQKTL